MISEKLWMPYKGIQFQTWIILISNLINRVGTATILFLSIYLHSLLSFSLNQIGFLLGFYGFGSLLGSFSGGILSDKIQPLFIVIFSLLTASFFFFLLPFLHNYYFLSLWLLLLGYLTSIGQPATNLVLNACIKKEERLKVFSLYRVTNNIGLSITAMMGGFLSTINFSWLFYLDAMTSLLAGLFLLYFINSFSLTQKRKLKVFSKTSFFMLYKDHYFFKIWLILLTTLLIFSQLLVTYPLYLHQIYKISTQEIGIIFAFNSLSIILFQAHLTHFLRNLSLPLLVRCGILLIGLGVGFLPFGTSFCIALLSCFIWTLGEMLFFPAIMALVLEHIHSKQQGKYMAMYDIAFSISKLFFPLLGMILYQYLGGNLLWEFFLCLSILAISFSCLKKRSLLSAPPLSLMVKKRPKD